MKNSIVPLYAITFEVSGPIINIVMDLEEAIVNPDKYKKASSDYFTWNEAKAIVTNYYLKKVEIINKQTEEDYFKTLCTEKNVNKITSMISEMEESVEDGIQALAMRRYNEALASRNQVPVNRRLSG